MNLKQFLIPDRYIQILNLNKKINIFNINLNC